MDACQSVLPPGGQPFRLRCHECPRARWTDRWGGVPLTMTRNPIPGTAGSRFTFTEGLTGADMARIEVVLDAEYRRVLTERILLVREGMSHVATDGLLHDLGETLSHVREVGR